MKSQDIVVAIRLLLLNGKKESFSVLAKSLNISTSETFAAVNRLKDSHLVDPLSGRVQHGQLKEFIQHGINYVFPAELGKTARGVITGFSAPFAKSESMIMVKGEEYIWPYSSGKDRGISLTPLYKTVPEVCLRDHELYEWLSVIDMLRVNRSREKEVAIKDINRLFEEIGKPC